MIATLLLVPPPTSSMPVLLRIASAGSKTMELLTLLKRFPPQLAGSLTRFRGRNWDRGGSP